MDTLHLVLRVFGVIALVGLLWYGYKRREKLGIFTEFYHFMKVRKKWWLGPIFLLLIMLSVLIVLTAGTPVAPFIYTLF